MLKVFFCCSRIIFEVFKVLFALENIKKTNFSTKKNLPFKDNLGLIISSTYIF